MYFFTDSISSKTWFFSSSIFLNFNDDIYHKEIKLFLKNFIRDEQKFENIDELKNQVLDDIESAKKYR